MKFIKQEFQIKILGIILLTFLTLLFFKIAFKKVIYPIIVSIELKADQNEICQLFYSSDGSGFNESQSLLYKVSSSTDFKEVVFHLPITKANRLRIDPGVHSGSFDINKITIQVGKQKVSYSSEDILQKFDLTNLKKSENRDSSFLSLSTLDNPDVQMTLKENLSEGFELENIEIKNKITWGLSIFYLVVLVLIISFGNKIYKSLRRLWFKMQDFPILSFNSTDLIDFLKTNRWLIVFSLIVAVFSFGYELFNFSLSIDEEFTSFRTAVDDQIYVKVGRWGLYFLNLFFQPVSLIPYYPTLIALLCIATTSIFFVIHSTGSQSSKIVFMLLFISSPIHTYYLTFNTVGLYLSMGMVFATTSYLFFKQAIQKKHPGLKQYLLSILFLAFSISIYQSNLAFFLVFGMYYVLTEALDQKNIRLNHLLRIIVRLSVVIVLGYLVYKIGDIVSRHLILDSDNKNNTQYLDNFIKWGTQPVTQILGYLYQSTIELLTGTGFQTGFLGLSLKSIPFFLTLFLLQILRSRKGQLQKLISIIALFFLIVSPFTLIYLNGSMLPMRSMSSLTLMIALLWFIIYRQSGIFLRKILFIAALLIMINNTWINTRLFYATNTAWQADRDIANRIIERVFQLDPPEVQGKIVIAFSGIFKHPENELFLKSETQGASFYEWDRGTPFRIQAFFKTIGINKIEVIPIEKMSHKKIEIETMPFWPSKGSVALFDNVVIVKFSN
jgi:hypothetical protein